MELPFADWRLPTGKPFGIGHGTESMVWKVCPTNWQLPIRQIGAASGRRPRRIKSDRMELPLPIGNCQSSEHSARSAARSHRIGGPARRNWQLPIRPAGAASSRRSQPIKPDPMEIPSADWQLPIGNAFGAGYGASP